MFFQLKENGYQYRVVPIDHLSDLREEIEERRREGFLPEDLYLNYIARFVFQPPQDFSARSIIIMALPRPKYEVIFHWRGEAKRLNIPPTYSFYSETLKFAEVTMNAFLHEKGYGAKLASLPLKLLAVRSGLAKYGRNNITYIPQLGSFYQLAGLYSDLPPEGDPWQEVEMMASCNSCRACLKNCPTQAITEERFRIRTERCIAYYSENKGEFPSWMELRSHSSLIGCLRCQEICPQTQEHLSWVGGKEEFSEEETELFLRSELKVEDLSEKTKEKMVRMSPLFEMIEILSRNLNTYFSGKP